MCVCVYRHIYTYIHTYILHAHIHAYIIDIMPVFASAEQDIERNEDGMHTHTHTHTRTHAYVEKILSAMMTGGTHIHILIYAYTHIINMNNTPFRRYGTRY